MMELIKSYSSTRNIADSILSDIKSSKKHRYAARFVLLYSYDQLSELVEYLNGIKVVGIESRDTIPLFEDYLFQISSCKSKHICVPHITELLRINEVSDMSSRLITLCDINSNDNLETMIVPIVGLDTALTHSLMSKLESSGRYPAIYQAPMTMKQKIELIRLSGIEWLELERLPEHEIIHRNMLFLFSLFRGTPQKIYLEIKDPSWEKIFNRFVSDNIFLKTQLRSIQELIRHSYGVDISITFNADHASYWKTLFCEICRLSPKGCSEREILSNILNIKDLSSLDDRDFLDVCYAVKNNENGAFKIWFLSNHMLFGDYPSLSAYLKRALRTLVESGSISFNALVNSIWFSIFNDEYATSEKQERSLMLLHLHSVLKCPTQAIETILCDKLSSLQNLDLVTGITNAELRFVCAYIADCDEDMILSEMYSRGFHSLSYYLGIKTLTIRDLIPDNEWAVDYIHHYTLSKLKNKKASQLSALLDEKNSSQSSIAHWYSSFKTVSSITALYKSVPIIWIDGLGLEWLSYITNLLLATTEFEVHDIFIARSEVPSITKLNKIENPMFSIKSLDNYIHSQLPYHYPNSLVDELCILKDIVTDIQHTTNDPDFLIVADHGFTFLSQRHYGVGKKYDFSNSEHEGRYTVLEQNSNCYSSSDYIVYESCGCKYAVATKHTSLSNTPSREVHGGFTPEEVLTPVLYVKRKSRSLYEIEYSKIVKSIDGLKLRVLPIPQRVDIMFENHQNIQRMSHADGYWHIDTRFLMPKKYEATLVIDNATERCISFEVTGGIKVKSMEELFNA